jgi:hypothetical protein
MSRVPRQGQRASHALVLPKQGELSGPGRAVFGLAPFLRACRLTGLNWHFGEHIVRLSSDERWNVVMEYLRRRTLWTVLLAILVLIVFWLVMRFWQMRRTTPPPVGLQQHACAMIYGGTAAYRAYPAEVRGIEEGGLNTSVERE